VEGSGILGAGAGAAIAESVAPGEEGKRLFSELAGGILAPGNSLRLLPSLKGKITNLVGNFTKSGRQDRAASIVRAYLQRAHIEGTGASPEQIAKVLRLSEGKGTAGQLSRSPVLIALEKRLAAGGSSKAQEFAARRKEGAETTLGELREAIESLTRSKDPDALRVAAELRLNYFDELLTRQVEEARSAALTARAGISTSEGAADISKQATDILAAARTDARATETKLWNAIPKNIRVSIAARIDPSEPQGLASVFSDLQSRLQPTETLTDLGVSSKTLRNIENIIEETGSTTGDLLILRNRLLAAARDFGTDNPSKADVVGKLADGVLNDLLRLEDDATANARSFSTAFNDKFTRTFAGEALARTRSGAPRIAPELVLETGLGGSQIRRDLRFSQLLEATDFGGQGPAMLNAQERFLAAAAADTIDPRTGAVNPEALARFVNANQNVLTRFPQLRGQLQSAEAAERAFQGVERGAVSSRAEAQRQSFALATRFENPTLAVSRILNGNNPAADYGELAKTVKKAGQAAVNGLRASTIDSAFEASVSRDGALSYERFKRIMFEDKAFKGQTLAEMMRRQGIMSADQSSGLQRIVDRAIDFETLERSPQKLESLLSDTSALTDTAIRIAGAKAAGTLTRATGRAESLIAASAGSRLFRNIFDKVPLTRINDLLIEASSDPKIMALLLERPATTARAEAIRRQLNSFLVGTGLATQDEQ